MIFILVVDDIPVNRILLTCLLETDPNNKIEEAENGQEAIDMLRANKFDIVLMDIDMPVMNGLDATKYIREHISKDIPVIAVTAHMQNEIQSWGDVGFNKVIHKPINREEILSTIEEYTNLYKK